MSQPQVMTVSKEGEIVVGTFTETRLFDDCARIFEESILGLVTSGRPQLVLDFSDVESVSSTMLQKLIKIQRTVMAARGRIVLCAVHWKFREVLTITNLTPLFEFAHSREAALKLFESPISIRNPT